MVREEQRYQRTARPQDAPIGTCAVRLVSSFQSDAIRHHDVTAVTCNCIPHRQRLLQATAVSRVTASHHSSLPRAIERLQQSSAVTRYIVRYSPESCWLESCSSRHRRSFSEPTTTPTDLPWLLVTGVVSECKVYCRRDAQAAGLDRQTPLPAATACYSRQQGAPPLF